MARRVIHLPAYLADDKTLQALIIAATGVNAERDDGPCEDTTRFIAEAEEELEARGVPWRLANGRFTQKD